MYFEFNISSLSVLPLLPLSMYYSISIRRRNLFSERMKRESIISEFIERESINNKVNMKYCCTKSKTYFAFDLSNQMPGSICETVSKHENVYKECI